MMTTPQDTAACDFLFAEDHERIIYAAVRHLRLTPAHPDYEDYLQEGRLIFIQLYNDYEGDPTAQTHRFLAYAYQRVKWRLSDRLRRDRKRTEQQLTGDPTTVIGEQPAPVDLAVTVEAANLQWHLVSLVATHGTAGEWWYLKERLLDHRSITEIAARHGVGRSTVYRWRTAVMRRLARYFQKK